MWALKQVQFINNWEKICFSQSIEPEHTVEEMTLKREGIKPGLNIYISSTKE